MSVTENMKSVKINTVLKDKDGYFIIMDYDKQEDAYICVQCDDFILAMFNEYGSKIFKDKTLEYAWEKDAFIMTMEDLVELGTEIITEDLSMEFVLCYEKLNESGFYENTWETIIGEDAMNIRLTELEDELEINPDDVMVFNRDTEW